MRKESKIIHQVPWNGIATEFKDVATAEEALATAGLNFTTTKIEVKSLGQTLHEKYAMWRTDKLANPKGYLGMVGKGYHPIQNVDAMSFFDNIVAKDEAIYHSAGLIGNGERVWLLAKLPGRMKINNKDLIDKYVLIINSHNGLSSLLVKFTTVRLVCNNSLNIAINDKSQREVRIKHRSSADEKIKNAHKIMGIAQDAFHSWETKIKKLAKINISGKELHKYFDKVLDIQKSKKISTKLIHRKELLDKLFKEGAGADISGGTVWGALNAVTEYNDHFKNYKNGKNVHGIWFGSGDRMKIRAERVAEEMFLQ